MPEIRAAGRLRIGLLGAGSASRGVLPSLLGTGLADLAWVADPLHAGERVAGQTVLEDAATPLGADLLLLAVPESALPLLVENLAERLRQEDGRCRAVLQFSASSPLQVLDPLRAAGVWAGLLHPMQTFPKDAPPPENIPFWALGGDAELRSWLGEMMNRLADDWIWLEAADQIPYHLCGVLASNFLPPLLSLCESLWPGEAGQAHRALQPIMSQTLANLLRYPPHQAVSGPAARGDMETIRRHLSWMENERPDLIPLYTRLTEEILALRQSSGSRNLAEAPVVPASQTEDRA
jgi:predicted short-subunit dehydrogenase-like oxidoreductase (DUF2520 family)